MCAPPCGAAQNFRKIYWFYAEAVVSVVKLKFYESFALCLRLCFCLGVAPSEGRFSLFAPPCRGEKKKDSKERRALFLKSSTMHLVSFRLISWFLGCNVSDVVPRTELLQCKSSYVAVGDILPPSVGGGYADKRMSKSVAKMGRAIPCELTNHKLSTHIFISSPCAYLYKV